MSYQPEAPSGSKLGQKGSRYGNPSQIESGEYSDGVTVRQRRKRRKGKAAQPAKDGSALSPRVEGGRAPATTDGSGA